MNPASTMPINAAYNSRAVWTETLCETGQIMMGVKIFRIYLLAERIAHVDYFEKKLEKFAKNVIVLLGGMEL